MEGSHPETFNDDGTPKVFYHGTESGNINKFQGHRGVAGHFSFAPEMASDFAEGAHNLLLSKLDSSEEKMPHNKGAVVYPVYINSKNIFDIRNPDHRKIINYPDNSTHEPWEHLEQNVSEIENHGFDSYYDFEGNYKNHSPTGIAVFHPHQIKSAIGNNGDFDPTKPEIHKEGGGEVEDHVKDFLWAANHQQKELSNYLDIDEPNLPHLNSIDDVMSADPTVKQSAFGQLKKHLIEKETPVLHKILQKHGVKPERRDRNGHYWYVEDPETLDSASIRWMKDHKQQGGGGFNPHTGERSGEDDIDVHYDPDGILNVHSSATHPSLAASIAKDLHAAYHGKDAMDVLHAPEKSFGGEVDDIPKL